MLSITTLLSSGAVPAVPVKLGLAPVMSLLPRCANTAVPIVTSGEFVLTLKVDVLVATLPTSSACSATAV